MAIRLEQMRRNYKMGKPYRNHPISCPSSNSGYHEPLMHDGPTDNQANEEANEEANEYTSIC